MFIFYYWGYGKTNRVICKTNDEMILAAKRIKDAGFTPTINGIVVKTN